MIHVATCVYGINDRMFEMLRVYAYSVAKNVDCRLFIYNDGLTTQQSIALSRISDRICLVSFSVQDIKTFEKPAQKVKIWSEITNDPVHKSQPLVLSDFDMLFLGDPSHIFGDMQSDQVDLCYTLKDDCAAKYRLSNGILFMNEPEKCRQLMRAWASDVARSLENRLVADAMASSHGSVDQCVLANWLQSENSMCRSRSVSSSVYNLHKDWGDIPADCCVIHYKSDWSKVLTCGDNFRRCLEYHGWWKREEARNWKPAFDLWKKYQRELEDSQSSM